MWKHPFTWLPDQAAWTLCKSCCAVELITVRRPRYAMLRASGLLVLGRCTPAMGSKVRCMPALSPAIHPLPTSFVAMSMKAIFMKSPRMCTSNPPGIAVHGQTSSAELGPVKPWLALLMMPVLQLFYKATRLSLILHLQILPLPSHGHCHKLHAYHLGGHVSGLAQKTCMTGNAVSQLYCMW